MEPATARLARRRSVHETLAARLAAMDDDALTAVLNADGVSWRTHALGGQSGVIEVEGVKVFVKKLALPERERAVGDEGSTANLFDLPLFYQYGVGSAGFGAGRELRACLKAGAWALSGQCPHFPLVYHWRTMRTKRPPLSAEQQAWLDGSPAYWNNSDAVRARLDAISQASAAIVLFLEYAPYTLDGWLTARLAEQAFDTLEAPILRLHDLSREVAGFMNDRGLLHFDLHTHNVLTDGEQLYVADFGLALCDDFDLAPAERAAFETHRLYDRAYVDWSFVNWLYTKGDAGPLTPALQARMDRCMPVATVLQAFLTALRQETKTTPYPAAEIAAALAAQPNA